MHLSEHFINKTNLQLSPEIELMGLQEYLSDGQHICLVITENILMSSEATKRGQNQLNTT